MRRALEAPCEPSAPRAWTAVLGLGLVIACFSMAGCTPDQLVAFADHLEEFLYVGTFTLLFLCGVVIPIPEEPILLAAGYAAYRANAHVGILIVCAIAGILCGDTCIYMIGKRHGDRVFRSRLFSYLLREDRLALARRKFSENGAKVVFFGRFIAGIRYVVYFTAGNIGVPYRTFLFMDLLGTLLTIPVSIWATWYFGAYLDRALLLVGAFQRVVWSVLIGGLGVYLLTIAVRARRAASAPARG